MASRRTRTAPPTLRKAIQEHTRAAYRDAILEAAATVFGRMGFHDAKMSDIAEQAGVSVGTLYNYFGSKDEVVGSLVTHEHEQFRLAIAPAEASADPLERILGVVRTSYEFLEARGALLAMAMRTGLFQSQMASGCCSPEEGDAHEHAIELYEKAFAAARDQGRIRPELSPRLLAFALDGMASAMVFEWMRGGQVQPLGPQSELVFDLIMKGAAAR